MSDQIDNVPFALISSAWKLFNIEKPTKFRNDKARKNIKELKELVEKVKGVIDKLIEAEDYGDIITDLEETPKYLEKLLNKLKNKSSGHEVIKEISSVSDGVDLSVMGLNKENLKSFWDMVKNFKNLISLSVAMSVTEPSAFTLPDDCGVDLKKNLKRLRMEGKFPIGSSSKHPYSGLDKLNEFKSLTDLTLVSDETINTDRIPAIEKLLCLRLYGVCKDKICKIEAKQFKSLKELVIGDMKDVETVEIGGGVIKTLATLELCKLPNLKKLVCPDKKQILLTWENKNNKAEWGSKEDQSLKTIFLRDIDSPKYKSSSLTINRYDMNKQCYIEVKVKCIP